MSYKNNKITTIEDALAFIDDNTINNLPWHKLRNSVKCNKIEEFINNNYAPKNKLSKQETKELIQYLIKQVESKNLQTTKDITFNKDTQTIEDIPILIRKSANNYTLKTLVNSSSLKRLTPIKPNKTSKNKTKKLNSKSKNKKLSIIV